MSTEAELLATNQAFYAAFRDHDIEAMEELWAEEAPVACLHPGWPVLRGRDVVLESWRRIFESGDGPEMRCAHAVAHVLGDSAFVTCIEAIGDGQLAATNLFVRERGMWRMVMHQAGPTEAQAMPDPGIDDWN